MSAEAPPGVREAAKIEDNKRSPQVYASMEVAEGMLSSLLLTQTPEQWERTREAIEGEEARANLRQAAELLITSTGADSMGPWRPDVDDVVQAFTTGLELFLTADPQTQQAQLDVFRKRQTSQN